MKDVCDDWSAWRWWLPSRLVVVEDGAMSAKASALLAAAGNSSFQYCSILVIPDHAGDKASKG